MFFGRENELKILNDLFKKKVPSLVVCRGRRRIGKSTLIEEFSKKADRFLVFQGLAPEEGIGKKAQLEAFAVQLARQTNLPQFQIQDWSQAFTLLANTVTPKKTVILLDEISWMAAGDRTFSGYLKIAWDTQFKKHTKLILVVCGSVSSWIDKNILNNSGYVGRVSLDIVLPELPLPCCNKFFGSYAGRISAREKFKVLAVTGGVPRYLEEINPAQTPEENILRTAFHKEGILFHEFESIFNDVFGRRSGVYREILKALAAGRKNVSAVCEAIGSHRGGVILEYLNNLTVSGFLAKETSVDIRTGNPTRSIAYRLQDNYIRFYLKYIEPRREEILRDIYKSAYLENIVNWESIAGIQFETLVLNNRLKVCSLLGIEPGTIRSISPYIQKPTLRQKGCQIDLLIQTRQAIYPCEIKFQKQLSHTIIQAMENKVSRLKIPSGKSLRPVLIYSGELAESVRREDYFNNIIDFEDMLK